MVYDKIIIGAGIYGMYAAIECGRRGQKILVLECDTEPFMRGSFVNQARVHMGYHYPRSLSTAVKSAKYFNRFCSDYGDCINGEFDQVYATGAAYSWTNAAEFMRFCKAANIRCDVLPNDRYFNDGMCDGTFLTTEYTFDAKLMAEKMLGQAESCDRVEFKFGSAVSAVTKMQNTYVVTANGEKYETPFLLNATYASTNQILSMLELPPLKIKYELCEIILCTVSESLKNVGITVMDGPFFSIMPFGKTGYHSLTAVTFTPHVTSYDALPTFNCQRNNPKCSPSQLMNCDGCPACPDSAYPYMSQLARKFLKDEYRFEFVRSHFSMKPILKASEIDDSRPTLVRTLTESPTLVSVFSGKINTIYDLDEVLK
ncbi:MAG: FAD-dependent oxidoreductase [Oscillospiraceae bacterium]